MLAQRSEKNSKRDEIGLFAEPVEGAGSQSTKGRASVRVSTLVTKKDNNFSLRLHCVQIRTATIQSVLRDLLPEVKLTT